MLRQMLKRLERAPLKQHNCLMLRAALALGFFSFLWVGKSSTKNRSFNPRFHPTMQDISWSREGMRYFVKQPKMAKWAEVPPFLLGVHTDVRVQWRSIWDAATVQPHSSTAGMGCHSHPMFFPWTFLHLIEQCGLMQPNSIHTVCALVLPALLPGQASLHSDTIQKLLRWRSCSDGEAQHTRHSPVTP